MSYRGVFLDKVHPNVRKKLDYMHANAGDVKRLNRDEEQQTPWIKLTSNAASKEVGFPVAQDYVMYSDILDASENKKSHEKLEGWQHGGGLYGSNHLNRPVPVIESISIANKGALGSIRTANIKGTVFAETDLVWFEKLYMMPGITLLLEWGHSNTDTTPIVIGPDTRVSDVQIDILKKTLKSSDFRSLDGNPDVAEGSVRDVGTYDGMLGVITKFNWTNGAKGYDFSIDIISPNSVMNSFNMSTNTLGIKIKKTTTVDDYSIAGNEKDTKIETTTNSTPLDDLEGMLTHLKAMGESVSNVNEKVHLKKNDEGKLEDMGPDPLQEMKQLKEEGDFQEAWSMENEARKYANQIDITRKTSKSSVLEMNESALDAIPYTFSGIVNGKNTIIKNEDGHLVGMTAYVPNNETFGTGKDEELDIRKTKVTTFISWMFLEELINSRLPGEMGSGKHKKKLVKLNSTTLGTNGKYFSNQISGHRKMASVNRGVCQLIGNDTLPYNFEVGEFNDQFPTWSNKEQFHNLKGNKFFTNEEEISNYAKHFLNPMGINGSLDGIWLNVDFIIQKYRQNKSEFNKFLFALLSGVNSACGEPWDFHIQNNPNDPGKMAVVDLNMVDPEVAKEIRADRDGIHIYKFRTQLGILRNINLSSKLPKAIASSAYVAAAAANAGDYDEGSGMNLYQKDKTKPIYDSLSIKNADVEAIQTKGDDEDETDSQLPSTHIIDMKMSAWKAILFGKDIGSAQSKMKDYINKELKQNNKEEKGDTTSMPAIPIELSFSMDGLSGLYMGNAIMLDTIDMGGVLPDRYKQGVAFQITQVSHKVNSGGWDTDVTCMMRMTGTQKVNYPEKVDQVVEDDAPVKPKQEAKVTTPPPKATAGGNGPPSSRATNALHPLVQEDWEDIVDDLRALGWQPRVVTAFRSIEEQGEKLAKGLSKVGYGYHGCLAADGSRASQALDVIDARYSYGNHPKSIKEIGKKATEDLARKFWGDLGRIAEEDYGFRWGGKFGKNGRAYYDFNGTPSENKIMGWDPGHIEKFGKDGLPTLTEAAENAGKFLGRKIHLRANNVV